MYGFAAADEDDSDREHDRRREDPLPPLPSTMSTLAWTVLHGNFHDRRDAARVLAQMILEAGL